MLAMQRLVLLARLAPRPCRKLQLGWTLGALLRQPLATKRKQLDKPLRRQRSQALHKLLQLDLKLLQALLRSAHKLLLQRCQLLPPRAWLLGRRARLPRLAHCKLVASCPALRARLAVLLLARAQLRGAPPKSLLARPLCNACWTRPRPTLARLARLQLRLPSKC